MRMQNAARLLAWTGHPRQRSDQIDAAAYAAIIAESASPGIVVSIASC